MLRFSAKKGEEAPKRFANPLLELTPDEAMELSKHGSAREVSDFLAKGALKDGPTAVIRAIPDGLQDALSERLERAPPGRHHAPAHAPFTPLHPRIR
jgi:hypothetical protein